MTYLWKQFKRFDYCYRNSLYYITCTNTALWIHQNAMKDIGVNSSTQNWNIVNKLCLNFYSKIKIKHKRRNERRGIWQFLRRRIINLTYRFENPIMSRYHRCWVGKRMSTLEWCRTFQLPADSDEFSGGIAANERRSARRRNWEIWRVITVLKTKYKHKTFYLCINHLNWIKSFKHGDYLLLTVQSSWCSLISIFLVQILFILFYYLCLSSCTIMMAVLQIVHVNIILREILY